MALKAWLLLSIFLAMVACVALYVFYQFFIKLKKHQIDDFQILIVVVTIIIIIWLVKNIFVF